MKYIDEDEIPKYRKQAKHSSIKADHKHEFKDCLFEWDDPNGKCTHEKGFENETKLIPGSYCTICGRTSEKSSFSKWGIMSSILGFKNQEQNEEWEKQLNPDTRTLKVFKVKDPWDQKYVDISIGDN